MLLALLQQHFNLVLFSKFSDFLDEGLFLRAFLLVVTILPKFSSCAIIDHMPHIFTLFPSNKIVLFQLFR